LVKTDGMSALRWSWLHIINGFLGLTCIGFTIFFCNNLDNDGSPSWIHGLTSTMDERLLKADWQWRPWNEIYAATMLVVEQLDFWTMNVLFDPEYHTRRDSKHLTFMDTIAFYVFILSWVPGVLRLLLGIPCTLILFLFDLICDTSDSHPRVSPLRWAFTMTISGALSVLGPFCYLNHLLYKKREILGNFASEPREHDNPPSYYSAIANPNNTVV